VPASETGSYSRPIPYEKIAIGDGPVRLTLDADGRWHSLAMTREGTSIRLFVDGRAVAERKVVPGNRLPVRLGSLSFGLVVTGGSSIDCDGLVDEVRLSRRVRPIAAVPDAPFTADDATTNPAARSARNDRTT
jgi:hypothetical protein